MYPSLLDRAETGRRRAEILGMTRRLMIIVLLVIAVSVIVIMVKRYRASSELDCPCCNSGGQIDWVIG